MALVGFNFISQIALAIGTLFNETAIAKADQEANITIQELNTKVDLLKQQANTLENSLHASAPNAAAAINSSLDLALANMYKLAVFVRGNYDDRGVDEAQKKSLLDLVTSSFQDVQTKSLAALTILLTAQEQAVELRNAQLIPVKDQIAAASQKTKVELEGLENSIKGADDRINRLDESNRTAEESMNALQEKKRSAEQASLAANVGLGIATFGIWSIIGAVDHSKVPSAVIGIQDDINALEQSIESTKRDITSARNELAALKARELNYQHLRDTQAEIQRQLPGLETKVEANIAKVDMMVGSVVDMKDLATQLCQRMGQLQNAAIIAGHESFTKKEFVAAILDMCLLAAVDKPRVVEIKLITSEVVSEYGGKGLTKELQA